MDGWVAGGYKTFEKCEDPKDREDHEDRKDQNRTTGVPHTRTDYFFLNSRQTQKKRNEKRKEKQKEIKKQTPRETKEIETERTKRNKTEKKQKGQKETEKKQRTTDETIVKKKTQNMNRWHLAYAPSVKNEKSNMCQSRLHTCRPRTSPLALYYTYNRISTYRFFRSTLFSRTIPILRSCTSVRASLPRASLSLLLVFPRASLPLLLVFPRASLPLLLVYLRSPRSARHLAARRVFLIPVGVNRFNTCCNSKR